MPKSTGTVMADKKDIHSRVAFPPERPSAIVLRQRWIRWAILVGGYFFLVSLKIYLTEKSPRYNPVDDTILYQSEGALQYRYAKLIATGQSIPAIDHAMQAPEGLIVARELTIGMEYIAGYSYRFLAALGLNFPFHRYMVFFVAIFSSLVFFAVYGLAMQLWEDAPAALGAALLFAVIPAGLGRSVANYALEDFALPFVLGSLYFLARALRITPGRTFWDAMRFASCLAVALVTWHFSKFFLTSLIAGVIFLRVLTKESERLREPLLALAIVLGLCGITVPALRAQYFALSVPMLALYALLMSLYGPGAAYAAKGRAHILFMLLTGIGVLFVLSYPIQRAISADYAHVTSLLFYKLRYALIKPENPALLNMDARMLWIEDFNSPTLNFIAFRMSSLAILGPIALISSIVLALRDRMRIDRQLVIILTLIFAVGSVLVKRLFIFEIPLLCALLGSISLVRAPLKKILPILLALIVPIEAYGSIRYFTVFQGFRARIGERDGVVNADPKSPGMRLAMQDDYSELISWIRRRTAQSSVFLTLIGEGAEIVAYTGRGSNLQPKFETKASRDKAYEFTTALYSSEDELFRLALAWNTDYVIYHPAELLGISKESMRYFADAMSVRSDSAAFRFHFDPAKLKHFVLVYENPGCRVFRVKGGKESATLRPTAFEPPIFNKRLFQNLVKPDSTFDDASVPPVTANILRATQLNQQAYDLYSSGDYPNSLKVFQEIISHGYGWAAVNYGAGLASLRLRDAKSALNYLETATKMAPERSDAFRHLAYARMLVGLNKPAESALRKTLEIDPHDAIAANNLAVILFSSGDRSEARALLAKATELAPTNNEISRNYANAVGDGPINLKYLF